MNQVQWKYAVDSGPVFIPDGQEPLAEPHLAYSTYVLVGGAAFIRVQFDQVTLSGSADKGNAAFLQLSSLQDGSTQILTAETIAQWGNSSAYFNGQIVQIDLYAFPGVGDSQLKISTVVAGFGNDGGIASICGPNDDRVLSTDPRVARIWPVGCTASLIANHDYCMLTAGHCTTTTAATNTFDPAKMQIVEFSVPLSTINGNVSFADARDQYVVDTTSIQFSNTGSGDDWCVFGVYKNPITGLSAFQAQGASFALASSVPAAGTSSLRITGHGSDNSPLTRNYVQQSDDGRYTALTAANITYGDLDTNPGNSGSVIQHVQTGEVIGIHNEGGCTIARGTNKGTRLDNSGLQFALNNPLGICATPPPICAYPPWCCAAVFAADPSCSSSWSPQCDALVPQLCTQPVWTLENFGGTANAVSSALDPNPPGQINVINAGPALFDPAANQLQAFAAQTFKIGTCPSTANGVGRLRLAGMGTPLAVVRWKALSETYWSCHTGGPDNFASGDLNNALLSLGVTNTAAIQVPVNYQFRLYTFCSTRHDDPTGFEEDLPTFIMNGTFNLNGNSQFPPGSFDLSNVIAIQSIPLQAGAFQLTTSDTVDIELNANSIATIAEPGNPLGGPIWKDTSHAGFVGTLILSLAGPIPTDWSVAGTPPVCGTNACCLAGVGPGCSNQACCSAVCAVDPFCCQFEWDQLCADRAGLFPVQCGCPVIAATPPNDSCATAQPIALGSTTFDTSGATGSGPDDPCFPPPSGQANDIWYEFTPSCAAPLTITLTPQYDLVMGIYLGACPVPGQVSLPCAFVPSGTTATFVYPTAPGVPHYLRIGGMLGASGLGTIDLSMTCCPPDLNGDGTVNVDDLVILLGAWGPCPPGPCSADIAPPPNGNGIVNVDDLVVQLGSWGPCP